MKAKDRPLPPEEDSFLLSGDSGFIESLYEEFLEDPNSVSGEWQKLFSRLQKGPPPLEEMHKLPFAERDFEKELAVAYLLLAYRLRGHQMADLDPLKLSERPPVPDLDPAYHGLGAEDMSRLFRSNIPGLEVAPLSQILQALRRTWCGTIGVEYLHIADDAQRKWVQEKMETCRGEFGLLPEERREILGYLVAVEGFEKYLHAKYVGQKRFSLEGGESLIPALADLIEQSGKGGVDEVVIGMAHRGRLNVLVNILGKRPQDVFAEFEGKPLEKEMVSGDVKYHLGFSANIATAGQPVHVALGFNPSHLEAADPVIEGASRARQDRRGDKSRSVVLPVLIHGDASFAGQGVVMETFNLSQTRGYTTGGTLHIIVNNQIGFTTSVPLDARSTLYCSDIAKAYQAPIFHVNGDDPEAVVFVTRLAFEFRMRFRRDAVIDLVCYRRHGHNEADEPSVTQPLMYRIIREHPEVRRIYGKKLADEGVIAPKDADAMMRVYRERLEKGVDTWAKHLPDWEPPYHVDWSKFKGTKWDMLVTTGIPKERIFQLMGQATTIPEGFILHPRVEKIIEARLAMGRGDERFDWGGAETLAYASLVEEGIGVRLSGQDSGRGTFFHRHAVLHCQEDGSRYIPLQHISPGQAEFLVIDSPLSEEAVLGFEVGYTSAEPNKLVVWEAQFGDFANVAQVMIDQFISSSETKWQLLSGVTLLLPHGYEGQGPEHSSARIERFLQMCAQENMQVCIPSTAAQIFHLLRRQMLRPYRKPLVVFTPKSLLRLRDAASPMEDFVHHGYRLVIGDPGVQPQRARRVVLCAGKVYYDLLAESRARGIEDVAIIRIEQLYPFPYDALKEALSPFSHVTEIFWVQEEPRNQGAWFMTEHRFLRIMAPHQKLKCVSRPSSASPAVGYYSVHLAQQKALVNEALS